MVTDNLSRLHGLRVGIVGLGTIGIAVARLLKAYGCVLGYYDPAPRDQDTADALSSGHLGGAAVDVYGKEPPEADSALLGLDAEAQKRLLLTPHIAGVTLQASQYLFQVALDNVERVLLRGKTPHHRVY
jgi:phosphoglycerate dehydrogenase-like enzyme